MKIGTFTFDRVEFAGSLGDLGTLIPLSVALIVICGLSVTSVFLMVGLFYIFTGLYYKLPIPVQPLKVVSAIAIAYPAKITLPLISASGLIFGLVLLFLAATGLIDWIAKFFTRPVIRGIQLGLGFILIKKGIDLIVKPELFIQQSGSTIQLFDISINPMIGILGSLVTILLISSRRFPAAIVVVVSGVFIGIWGGSLDSLDLTLGPTPIEFFMPSMSDFVNAAVLLVLPQIPLTIGNAIIGTSDACRSLFGKNESTERATYRAFTTSMGLANIVVGFVAAMPMCHGAGGLAGHYRFGARTGGSNIMIGTIFLVIALVFGAVGISLLMLIPNAVLGILLLFAGLELALLIRDLTKKNDLFMAFLIAGVGFATTNMGIAFFIGIIVQLVIRWRKIEL
ncbi:MAG: sulfate permease [Proteobacteria bacterium]|nr:sulfate permease [Pseudomonadota bacterium]